MFLMSFAKSLPRLASMAAFLCFVVAHLEWPDKVSPRAVNVQVRRRSYVVCRPLPSASSRPFAGPPSSGVADDVDEELVEAVVAGHLGVEARGDEVPLPDRHRVVRSPGVDAREDLHALPHLLDPRGADEDGTHRLGSDLADAQVLLEGVHLPSEGVAAHGDVETAEGL